MTYDRNAVIRQAAASANPDVQRLLHRHSHYERFGYTVQADTALDALAEALGHTTAGNGERR